MLVRRVVPWTDRPSGLANLDRMRHEMLGLFDALLPPPVRERGVFPPINVTQDADNFYIRCELPGVKPEDLDVGVVHQTLTLSGKREASDEEGVSYHRRERVAGTFSRSIVLPAAFDADGIEAISANGLLTITLPLAEAAKPRQIEVQQATGGSS